jgi:hypothetical protein
MFILLTKRVNTDEDGETGKKRSNQIVLKILHFLKIRRASFPIFERVLTEGLRKFGTF